MDYHNQIVEGLPSSYDVTYIIKNKKKCGVCNSQISTDDIKNRTIIYGEYYDSVDFCHKSCLEKQGFSYKHKKENDINSPIKIIKQSDIDSLKPKRKIKSEKRIDFSRIKN